MLRAFTSRSFARLSCTETVKRPFSTSFPAWGKADSDLVHKLQSEIDCEQEPDKHPKFVKDFLKKSAFKLHDTPMHDEITLTRQLDSETIRVRFSISDANNASFDEYYPQEEDEPLKEDQDDLQVTFPVHASVSIEKKGGALVFDTVATDGEIIVEQVSFYKDPSIAMPETSDSNWKRLGIYHGPEFAELDEDLQDLFERFIQERGVDDELARFLPDYVEHKEQREYISWLQHVKDFVGAKLT